MTAGNQAVAMASLSSVVDTIPGELAAERRMSNPSIGVRRPLLGVAAMSGLRGMRAGT